MLRYIRYIVIVIRISLAIVCFGSANQSSLAQVQIHRFERITVDDGLPMNGVNKIVQDHDGFIWFGTQDGLCRYDANSIRVFRHQDGDTTSLAGNFIQAEIITRNGTLLIGTTEGLSVYNPLTETFTNYHHDPKKPSSLAGNYIMSLYEDSKQNIWICSQEGLNIFQPGTGTMQRVFSKEQCPPFVPSVYCMNVIELPNGNMVVATRQGVWLWNTATSSIEPYHELWKATIAQGIDLQSKYVSAMYYNSQYNKLWLGTTDAGALYYDPATHQLKIFQHHPKNISTLNSNNIRDITEVAVKPLPLGMGM